MLELRVREHLDADGEEDERERVLQIVKAVERARERKVQRA